MVARHASLFPVHINLSNAHSILYSASRRRRTWRRHSPVVHSCFEMHPRACYALAFVLAVSGGIECDDKTTWYSELRTVVRNCPSESWNNSDQDEFLEKFRRCVQERALVALDSLLADDVIQVFDGLDLVRYQEDRINTTKNYVNHETDMAGNWTALIVNRLVRVLRTHVFKVDVDHLTNDLSSSANDSRSEVENVSQGRRRRHRRRHNHMMPMMMMGFLLMGSILIPMGFQFLAVLGGKALILAKMALILSSIQGLKKIATNGVNYGLYHSPVAEGWHERSHPETPSHFDLPYPPYVETRP